LEKYKINGTYAMIMPQKKHKPINLSFTEVLSVVEKRLIQKPYLNVAGHQPIDNRRQNEKER
jgi:hypothetical protein